jgi:hypothetical protein
MTEHFKITDDIPVPGLKGKEKYPWSQMKIGQSIFIPGDSYRAGQAAKKWGKERGVTFIARLLVENGVKGLRVWRTK